MMLLALDTTSAVATAALWRDGDVILEKSAESDRKHAETVLPLVQALLAECGVTLAGVDRFAVDIGPGSFTGVRIGVCMVNAFAYAQGKQVVGVGALRALALPYDGTETRVCTLIDARNGNAYAAQYMRGNYVAEPEAVVLSAYLPAVPQGAQFSGDVREVCGTARYPSAADVARIAAQTPEAAADFVLPLYLRASQAERLRSGRK